MVERINGTLEECLAKVLDKNQRNWDQQIPRFLLVYRSVVHETTEVTSVRIIFENDLRLSDDVKFVTVPPAVLCVSSRTKALYDL